MKYQVRNNHNSKITKVFDDLEAAINWCDAHMTKYGNRVTHIEGNDLVTDYDNIATAMAITEKKLASKVKRGQSL